MKRLFYRPTIISKRFVKRLPVFGDQNETGPNTIFDTTEYQQTLHNTECLADAAMQKNRAEILATCANNRVDHAHNVVAGLGVNLDTEIEPGNEGADDLAGLAAEKADHEAQTNTLIEAALKGTKEEQPSIQAAASTPDAEAGMGGGLVARDSGEKAV